MFVPYSKSQATTRLYLLDDHCFEAEAITVAVRENSVAFDQTCFYPGGGGQPPDEGSALIAGEMLKIVSAHADPDGVIWHITQSPPPSMLGKPVKLVLNRERRLALMRYHTALHKGVKSTLDSYSAML